MDLSDGSLFGRREKGAEGEQSEDLHQILSEMVNRRERGVFKWTCLYQKPSCRGEILTFQTELCTPYPSYGSKRQHTTTGAKVELVLP